MHKMIDVPQMLQKLDALFAGNEIHQAGLFLDEQYALAKQIEDRRALCTILNELVGYHRRTGDSGKALSAVEEALALVEQCGWEKTLTGANTYLNCATTRMAYGQAAEGLPLYERTEQLYQRLLTPNDYRFAGFYNNYALALVACEKYQKAEECYRKALACLQALGENESEQAVTYCNMAFLYHALEDEQRVEDCLQKALTLLDCPNLTRDGYYAFNCSKCADAYKYFGWFLDQKKLEERAEKIYERNRTV